MTDKVAAVAPRINGAARNRLEPGWWRALLTRYLKSCPRPRAPPARTPPARRAPPRSRQRPPLHRTPLRAPPLAPLRADAGDPAADARRARRTSARRARAPR